MFVTRKHDACRVCGCPSEICRVGHNSGLQTITALLLCIEAQNQRPAQGLQIKNVWLEQCELCLIALTQPVVQEPL